MYDKSTRAVFETLGAELSELEDWNCCGATAYMSVDDVLSLGISLRNLCIAEAKGLDLVTPCSGCYVTLQKAHRYYMDFPDLRDKLEEVLAAAELKYRGTVTVRHILDPIISDIGLAAIEEAVKRPLEGLKVAPYYGCQIVRPFNTFDDDFKPTPMDDLLESLGAEAVQFDYKTRCCGGSQMGTNQDLALRLVRALLLSAEESGAEMICTTCPLCQINLEAYQHKLRKERGGSFSIPVVYFTQLMAHAMGLSEKETQFDKHIEPVRRLLERVSREGTR
jgi:heterodisulfide reductase subunit B